MLVLVTLKKVFNYSIPLRKESLRLYNYCSNNPVRYVDPDGREALIEDEPNDKKKILDWINKYSFYQYEIKESKLKKNPQKRNSYGSHSYSEYIDEMIDASTKFHIKIDDKFIDPFTNEEYTVTGGATFSNCEYNDIFIVITGEHTEVIPNSKEFAKNAAPERILLHEIAGHAVPRYKLTDGNAVDIENRIISELNNHRFIFKLKPRMPDINHRTLKTY